MTIQRVKELLPAGLPSDGVILRVAGSKQQYVLRLKCQDRAEAYRVFAMFEPAPLTVVRHGKERTIKPTELVTFRDEAGELNDDVRPVYWRHHPTLGHYLEWWYVVHLADNASSRALVRVECHVKRDPAWLADKHKKGGPRGDTILSYEWAERDYPRGTVIAEAPVVKDRPGSRVVFFPSDGATLGICLGVKPSPARQTWNAATQASGARD